jgi:hypothetical protein
LHHPGAQQRTHEAEHGLVADAFLDRLHQPGVRNRRKQLAMSVSTTSGDPARTHR